MMLISISINTVKSGCHLFIYTNFLSHLISVSSPSLKKSIYKKLPAMTSMSALSTVTSILEVVNILTDKRKEAEAYLSEFAALSNKDKKVARPATIEKVFPLAFEEIAGVDSSANFQELKTSL